MATSKYSLIEFISALQESLKLLHGSEKGRKAQRPTQKEQKVLEMLFAAIIRFIHQGFVYQILDHIALDLSR